MKTNFYIHLSIVINSIKIFSTISLNERQINQTIDKRLEVRFLLPPLTIIILKIQRQQNV